MSIRLSILTLLLLMGVNSYSQKVFHLSPEDMPTSPHAPKGWFSLKIPLTYEGKYIGWDYKEGSTPYIHRIFYITADSNGKHQIVDNEEYCCFTEKIDLLDKRRVTMASSCTDSDVYILDIMDVYGYHHEYFDSIKLISYKKNSQFTKPVATKTIHILQKSYLGELIHRIYFWYTFMPCSNDYEFVMKNGDVFRITDITTVLYKPENKVIGDFCTMYSYKINGKKVISNFITLVRPGFEKNYDKYIENKKNHPEKK